MKLKIKLFAFVLLAFISCGSDEDTNKCNSENPLEDLQWLKDKKEALEKLDYRCEIIQYKYKGNYIYEVDDCKGCKNSYKVIYNCEGKLLCKDRSFNGEIGCSEIYEKATNKKVIWGNLSEVVIDSDLYNSTKTAGYEIIDVILYEGDVLNVIIGDSGCSGETWTAKLVALEGIIKTNPPIKSLKIAFENKERCTALKQQSFDFNVSKLRWDKDEIKLEIEGYDKLVTLKKLK